MKRILLVFAVAVISATASAQTSKVLTWGVEGGMNFNSLSFSSEMFGSGNRAGFFVGPKVMAKIPLLGFGADASVLYSLNSASARYNDGAGTSKNLSYLEIPMNLRYSFGLKVLSVYLATGPQYNYCMSGDKTIDELFGYSVKGFSRSSWGWNVGAGVEVMKHLQIGVSYTIPVSDNGNLSFSDAFGAVISPSSYKQKTVKVHLAYMF
ncbi:MAG: PorT family protein [Bacteroidaceae bacterium]|nr:PorT family protein [Bacteroidaceae bacterium]